MRFLLFISFGLIGLAAVSQNLRDTVVKLEGTKYSIFRKAGKEGVLKNNKLTIEAKYDNIKHLNTDLFAFRIKDKWGIISEKGKTIVGPTYNEIYAQSGPYFTVSNSDYQVGLLNKKGVLILDTIHSDIMVDDGDFYYVLKQQMGGIFGYNGKWIQPLADNFNIEQSSIAGYFIFSADKHQGIIKRNGEIVAPAIYDEVIDFGEEAEGVTFVRKDNKWGVINKKGTVLLAPSISANGSIPSLEEMNSPFMKRIRLGNVEGVLSFYKLLTFRGLIDECEMVLNPEHNKVYDFGENNLLNFGGRVSFIRQGNNWGLLNDNGKVILEPVFNEIEQIPNTNEVKATCETGTVIVKLK